jgi:glycosyltransferase involved in cell wall biosynthesis
VLREFPEATLVMGGQDKGYESGVRSEARSLGIAEHVRFVGFLDRAGKIREGSAADIFLNTNRVDNMPVGVVEACAMGIPVVATNVGGIPDMLNDGETALLVPDNDCEGMANAVKRLVKDPELAGRLSRNGRKLAAKSSWQAVRELWEEVFLELSAARQ